MSALPGVLLDASEEVVHVAVVDAPSHELLDALHFATTKRIDITCWTRQQMEGHATRSQQVLSVTAPEKHQHKVELLIQTLQSALEQRASDIHIEPADNAYRIRLRIDGVLHPLPDITLDAGVALTARLKVLGSLDIAEHRLPQDGQFTVELAGNTVSFRIATLPCRGGRKGSITLVTTGKPEAGYQRVRNAAVTTGGICPCIAATTGTGVGYRPNR